MLSNHYQETVPLEINAALKALYPFILKGYSIKMVTMPIFNEVCKWGIFYPITGKMLCIFLRKNIK